MNPGKGAWVTADGIAMAWDPARRLVRWRVTEPELVGTGKQASWMVETWRGWTGASEPFRILADCAGMASSDPVWRAILSDYLRANSRRVAIAWFNPTPVLRVMVEMFLVGTPALDGAVFSSESEAWAWLTTRRSDSWPRMSR
jgi:hypothetical protein